MLQNGVDRVGDDERARHLAERRDVQVSHCPRGRTDDHDATAEHIDCCSALRLRQQVRGKSGQEGNPTPVERDRRRDLGRFASALAPAETVQDAARDPVLRERKLDVAETHDTLRLRSFAGIRTTIGKVGAHRLTHPSDTARWIQDGRGRNQLNRRYHTRRTVGTRRLEIAKATDTEIRLAQEQRGSPVDVRDSTHDRVQPRRSRLAPGTRSRRFGITKVARQQHQWTAGIVRGRMPKLAKEALERSIFGSRAATQIDVDQHERGDREGCERARPNAGRSHRRYPGARTAVRGSARTRRHSACAPSNPWPPPGSLRASASPRSPAVLGGAPCRRRSSPRQRANTHVRRVPPVPERRPARACAGRGSSDQHTFTCRGRKGER